MLSTGRSLSKNIKILRKLPGNRKLFLGIFFGSPHEVLDVESLPVHIKKLNNGRVRLTCDLPMPYWRNARIWLHNRSGQEFKNITSRVECGGLYVT